jgi:hypothetical protein
LDSSAASTDVGELLLLDATDASSSNTGFSILQEDATGDAFDGGPFVLSEAPISVANPSFRVYLTTDQTVSNYTDTKIQFDAVRYDVGGYFDNVTNYRFTPLIAGYYNITMGCQSATGLDLDDHISWIYKNGAQETQSRMHLTGVSNDDLFASIIPVNDIIYLNGVDDYVEFYVRFNSEDDTSPVINDGINRTYAMGHLLTRTS